MRPRPLAAAAQLLVWTARCVAVLVALVAVLVAVALVGENTPFGRRFIATRVTAILTPIFEGRIVVESIGHVDPFGASGLRVSVRAPSGRTVLTVSGASARIDAVRLVRSLLGSSGVNVEIDDASADHVDLSVDTDAQGDLLLASALTPRKRPKAARNAESESARAVRVHVAEARLVAGWIHGRIGRAPPVDVDVTGASSSLLLEGGRLDVELDHAQTISRGAPEGADPRGRLDGRLSLRPGLDVIVDARFEGDVGGVATTAHAHLDGETLRASLRSHSNPGVTRKLLPELTIDAPFELTAHATGLFAALAVDAEAHVAASRATLGGRLFLGDSPRVQVTTRLRNIDISDFDVAFPHTDVSAAVDTDLVFGARGPLGQVRLLVDPGTIGAQRSPRLTARALLDGRRIDAHALVEHQAGIAVAQASMALGGASPTITLTATADARDLSELLDAPAHLRGAARVFADGAWRIGSPRIFAHAVISGERLGVPGVEAEHAFVDASIDGPVRNPTFHGTALAEGLTVSTKRFSTVAASADGHLFDAVVSLAASGCDSLPDLSTRARVLSSRGVELRDVTATTKRNGATVLLGADAVHLTGGRAQITRTTIVGLGEVANLSARADAQEIHLRLRAPALDLRRLALVLGRPASRLTGKLGADLDLVARRTGAMGHATVTATDLALDGIRSRGRGQLDVTIEDRRIRGSLHGRWNGSRVDVNAPNLEVSGILTDPHSWTTASGQVLVDAVVDIADARRMIPEYRLPLEPTQGRLAIALGLVRPEGDRAPRLTISMNTEGLQIAQHVAAPGSSEGAEVQAPKKWTTARADFALDGAIDPEHGTILRATARDVTGPLGDVVVTSPFALATTSMPPGGLAELFQRTPVAARVTLPRRDLVSFAHAFGLPPMEGSIELGLDVRGTLADPRVQLAGDLRDFRPTHNARVPDVSIHVAGTYDGERAELSATTSTGGARTVETTMEGHVPIAWLFGKDPDAHWSAGLRAKADRFPVETVPALFDERIHGRLTGTLDAKVGSDAPPLANVRVEVNPLVVGRFHDSRAAFRAKLADRHLEASARLDQAHGSLAADLVTEVSIPALARGDTRSATAGPLRLHATAKAFSLSMLRPLLRNVVARLGGRVDADLQVDAHSLGDHPVTRGTLSLTDGTFEFANVGREFTNVRANVTFQPDGTVLARDLTARGPSGSIEGNATIHLDGMRFVSGTADLQIPKRDALPVSVEGEILGEALGQFHAEARQDPHSNFIDAQIQVRKASVRIPERSPKSLQKLTPAPGVRIGVRRDRGQFEVLPEGPIPSIGSTESEAASSEGSARVVVDLHDVEIRRGTGLRVRLEGKPVFTTGKTLRVDGVVNVRDGFLDVQGKRFEIEKGVITFDGDPNNPQVVLTAGWTAPEGSRVYANFVGPLQTGKLTLRSEPTHTQSEILSLILFGTTSGSAAPATGISAGSAGTAGGVVGVGGGIATQGLSRALDDLTGLDVTARVDTSDSANPRPELEVRITRDVTVAVAHVLGVPPPFSNPDKNTARVNYRFLRNWFLETTFGDAGSSLLDLVWQYRY